MSNISKSTLKNSQKNPLVSTTPTLPPGIEFPCQFPIKILTHASHSLEALLKETLEKELENSSNIEYASRASTQGKYHSLTATFTASNREELDKIYQILSQNKDILWMI